MAAVKLNLTAAQIFAIGSIFIGLMVGILSNVSGVDPTLVASIGGAVATAWGALGTVLTGQAAQTAATIALKNQPEVQTALTQAVASYAGVENIQTNSRATPALKAMADNESFAKVLSPK